MNLTPHEPDSALRRAFDAWRAGRARPEFREGLLLRFVYGEEGSELASVLDSLRPSARPEFRQELRARFLSALDELEPAVAQPATPRRRVQRAPEAASEVRRRPRLLVGGVAALLAVAASILLWVQLTAGPALFQVDAAGFVAAGLHVGGEPVPVDTTPASLARRLERAEQRTVSTGPNSLRLVYGDQFVIELAEDTRLDFSKLGDEGAIVLEGDRGAYRVATGPGFEQAHRPLEFHTPTRHLRVVGTIFGVDVLEGDLVCVCCNKGEVLTWNPESKEQESVTERWTMLSSPDGPSRQHDFEEHQGPLRALRDFWVNWKP